jgi:hypothetical protein
MPRRDLDHKAPPFSHRTDLSVRFISKTHKNRPYGPSVEEPVGTSVLRYQTGDPVKNANM